MSRADVLGTIAASALPAAVRDYLAAFIKAGSDSGLRRALKADPAGVTAGIAGLLAGAEKALGLPASEALFATGFHPRNLSPSRLEAALAELRAVNFLGAEGFSSIRLVGRRDGKSPDIIASGPGGTCAFEVQCVTGASSFSKDGPAVLRAKLAKKAAQAASAVKRGAACSACVVFVLGEARLPGGREGAGLSGLARAAGEGAKVRVCVLAGESSAVWPPW